MSLYLGTTPIANDGSHNTANVDLSNLSNTGEAHFANPALTNSPYTTNRILEIPQDIKLELNNGTLTLKAGSKVYVPNGFEVDGTTPKFDYMTLESDKVVGQAGTVTGAFALYRSDDGTCYSVAPHGISSGATVPSSPVTTTTWYDTTNNVIKVYNGSKWISDVAFPLCIFSNRNSLVTSIDQIFNGFGYIGSTVFALPGVKVQCANGRNEDGTYITTNYDVTSVLTHTQTSSSAGKIITEFLYSPDNLGGNTANLVKYDSDKNFMYSGSTEFTGIALFDITLDANVKITKFEPKTVDSVANSNASNFSQAGRSYLSGLGMPSSRYIDLTLGATGSTYTAPANGYFVISKVATGVQDVVIDLNGVRWTTSNAPTIGWTCATFVPCKKNDTINVFYSAGGALNYFLFIYAEGEN